jgi:hypothetical protein
MSSILLFIFFYYVKKKWKEKKEMINALLNRIAEMETLFCLDCYEFRNSGKFKYWNNKQFCTQLVNNECWWFLD